MKMTLSGVEQIQANVATVSAFVTDPNKVGNCLPDLQELTVADQQHFTAFVKIGVGPIRGKFKMEVEIAPSADGREMGMKLKGSGMGNGLSMSSTMKLVETAADRTELHWSAEASVSGPLASVGGRLLEGQAKKTTEALFTNIRQALESARV
jgi:carbon monoxide dehydrogenase subunit G